LQQIELTLRELKELIPSNSTKEHRHNQIIVKFTKLVPRSLKQKIINKLK